MKLPQSFVSSLESAIEKRHKQGHSFHLGGPADEEGLIDFGSNDTLSIRRSDIFRREILHELESFQGFAIGAGSSRILHGSSEHVAKLEQLMADHYGCEDALLFNSGFEANLAIFSSLPQPGDIIIHDSLIHASIRDGIKNGRASIVRDFAHNDAESFRASLESVKVNSPLLFWEIKQSSFQSSLITAWTVEHHPFGKSWHMPKKDYRPVITCLLSTRLTQMVFLGQVGRDISVILDLKKSKSYKCKALARRRHLRVVSTSILYLIAVTVSHRFQGLCYVAR